MSEPILAPDGAPKTDPASQQPGTVTPKPDGDGQHVATDWEAEAKKAFEKRDTAKAASRAAAERNEALQKQVADLQAVPPVSQEDRERLAKIKADEAEAARNKAMKAGDADAIALAARKPLEDQLQAQDQVIGARNAQITKLLRDSALEKAVRSSELKPVDVDVVIDALRGRVTMKEVDGQWVPNFIGADGQPAFDTHGKVTDPQVFVDGYLKDHPGLCSAKSKPGSGATPPGPGSQPVTTEGRKPTSTEDWATFTPEMKKAANMKIGDWQALGVCGQPTGQGVLG